jgi:hypothetical protein
MSRINPRDPFDAEPTPIQLAAIEAEWPLIAAELELLDAHLVLLINAGRVSALDHRRIRRAQRRMLAARRAVAGAHGRPTPDLGGAA